MILITQINNNLFLMIDTQMLGHDSCDSSQATPTISSSSQTHFQPDFTKLHIATINCRGLPKTTDTSVRTHFIRYLRTHNLDILALQETHASSVSLQQVFHTQFQAHDSLWSRHCGLVCFSPDLSFSNSVFSICGRFITTTISHIQKAFDPLRVTVIYAPAAYSERQTFLSNLIGHPSSGFDLAPHRHILLGDFNYSYALHLSASPARQAPSSWLQYLEQYFVDGVTPAGSFSEATFHRGLSRSCIDYIFVTPDLINSKRSSSTTYIQPAWSDHCLVTLRMRLPTPASDTIEPSPITGKGIWRAHPRLAASPEFCAKLKSTISDSIASLPLHWSAQDKWDTIKSVSISVAKKLSRRQTSHLKSVEKLLHHKRASLTNSVSRFPDNAANLHPQLSVIESQLASIQQYHAETLALRSGIRWREMGEISAGYLKRTIAQRQSRQKISKLIHPTTGEICTSPTDLQAAARAFYSDLYSPDPINDGAVQDILSSIPSPSRLSEGDQDFLTSPIEWDDLMEQVRRCPNKSSPGLDGIPYEILRLLFTHPDCKPIILQVYNDGLTQGIFPPSWSRNCVSLLPKKGDLSDLKNWRPISLINTDAKVFTRILNSRIILCADTLITPFSIRFCARSFHC